MSNINRERTIQSIKDTPYIKEHPHLGELIEEWLNLMPDAEPTVFDGVYECDKKPGACPSWERKGWLKCMNPHCHLTTQEDHWIGGKLI